MTSHGEAISHIHAFMHVSAIAGSLGLPGSPGLPGSCFDQGYYYLRAAKIGGIKIETIYRACAAFPTQPELVTNLWQWLSPCAAKGFRDQDKDLVMHWHLFVLCILSQFLWFENIM